jgi:hypothetical protein
VADAIELLIGPDGRWFRENSPELFAELGDFRPDFDSTLFAIKNLGFIKFARYDSLVEITMHPRNVEELALHALQKLVSTSHARMFRINHFDLLWEHEIVSSAREAVVRLSGLYETLNSNHLRPPMANSSSDRRRRRPRSDADAEISRQAIEGPGGEAHDRVVFRSDRDEGDTE